jgi:hypothetical protein
MNISKMLLSIVALSSLTSFASEQPFIRGISYAGTGCPVGTVAEQISENSTQFSLVMDSFVVQTGRNIPMSENRKSYTVMVDMQIPAGWQYSVKSVQLNGLANLDSGVTGNLNVATSFLGVQGQTRSSLSLSGPLSKDLLISDSIAVGNRVWSPCHTNRQLRVVIDGNLRGRSSASGLLTLSGTEEKPLLNLDWRRC